MFVIHPSSQKRPSENVDRSLASVFVLPGREKLASENVSHSSDQNRFGSGRTTLRNKGDVNYFGIGENDMHKVVEFGERTQSLVEIIGAEYDYEISEGDGGSEGGGEKCTSGFWNHGYGRRKKKEEQSEQVMVPSGKMIFN